MLRINMASPLVRLLLLLLAGLVMAVPPTPATKGESPAIDAPPKADKDLVEVDLSLPLPELLKNAGFDARKFEADQLKKEADVAQYQQLESVSGGYWDMAVNQAESDSPTVEGGTALAKRVLPPGVISCLSNQNLKFYTSSESGYEKYATPYNVYYDPRPDVVVLAKSSKDVQKAVVCARRTGMRVQARSGGHSYAAYSSLHGGMVIDLRNMAKFQWDSKNRVAEAGGGIRLGNLALALLSKGQAMAHGDCPSVGLAGHSLHGGFGYASRFWGLSTDHITGMDVVTADGEKRYVSESNSPDLYWAMKGAGDSFGIVTKFYFQPQVAPKRVIHFTYNLNMLYGDSERMAAAFFRSQFCLQDPSVTDRHLGLTVRIATNAYRIAGYYYGSEANFKRIDSCLYKAIGRRSTIEVLTYADALATVAGRTPLKQPADANNVKSNFFAKSLLIPEGKPPSYDVMGQYFEHLITNGDRVKDQFTVTFRLMGGADSQISSKNAPKWAMNAAVGGRDSLWIVQHDGATARNPRNVGRFITGLTQTLASVANGGSKFKAFAPFLDGSLTSAEAHEKYFGSSTTRKLEAIKAKWDPAQMFWNPHAIGIGGRS